MVAPDPLASLRPVFWNPIRSDETCEVCTRPVSATEAICSTCRGHRSSGLALADIVLPLTYAPRPSQAMTDTYNYKELLPAVHAGARQRLFGLFSAAIARHARCIAELSEAKRVVTTVPSSQGRVDHPIDIAVRQLRSFKPLLEYVGPAGDAASRRIFDPDRWRVTDDVRGLHVLLVDDTWVSGARVQSCASALKQAGAQRVSALVLARHLDHYGAADDFLDRHKKRVWDPDICPVTGAVHV